MCTPALKGAFQQNAEAGALPLVAQHRRGVNARSPSASLTAPAMTTLRQRANRAIVNDR